MLAPTHRGLVRYLSAAVLARGADAGAGIGLLLLCVDPASGLDRPVLVGSLLVAGLTAPHLLGPLLARPLDRLRDTGMMLAAAMAGYGILLAAATLGLGRLPLLAVGLLVALAGACGPLLTGGLSSRLVSIVGTEQQRRRRGEGWDAVSYGVSGSLGPAVVAALAAATSARWALITLACAAVAAAGVTLLLPAAGSATRREPARSSRDVLRTMIIFGPLRRVSYPTMITALVLGGISVVAVRLAPELGHPAASGAVLAAALGIGNLVGSTAVTVRPLRGEPERLTALFVGVIAGTLLLASVVPSFPLALGAFSLIGVANAPFFAATLAARSEYAPVGGRAQLFVAIAAFKIAAGSAGTALAGALNGVGPGPLLMVGAVLLAATALATVIDRRRERNH